MAVQPIRVLLVDDHAIVREGLAALLADEPGLEVVGQAADGEQAVERTGALSPDVVLMDLVMPEMNGISATRAIRQRCPNTQIIALTNFKDQELVHGAMEAGAVDYLLKNISADQLAEAIRVAHSDRLAPASTVNGT